MSMLVQYKSIGIMLQFMISLSTAFCNVIGEALIVEMSGNDEKLSDQEQQNEAGQNVSFFFGIRSVGFLLSSQLSGFLLGILSKGTIFQITSIFPLLIVFATLGLNESKQRVINRGDTLQRVKTLFKFITKPEIRNPMMFIFLFMVAPDGSSAMWFFYIKVLQYKPIFLGNLKFIYALGSIVATFIYNAYLKQVSFKKQFIYTTLLTVVLGCSQLILINRVNLSLGIPDKLFTLGDSAIIQVINEINLMPVLVLACRICPKSIEGTMYACLISTLNLGGMVSGQLGAIMTYYLGVTEDNFDHLFILILISNVFQLYPVFLTHLLDPPKNQENQEVKKQDLDNFD